jgi:hypothetical protein
VDTSQFNRALSEYAATTKKDGDVIVNTAAKHLAMMAVRHTPHADKAKIEALKQVKSVMVFGKTGRRLKDIALVSKSQRERRTTYEATTAAFLIYLYWQHKAGVKIKQKFANRQAIEAAALAMVNARLRSVNYLRSGWLQAVKAFQNVRVSTPFKLPIIKNPGPGGARVSTGGRHSAEIWNSSLYSKHEGGVSEGLYAVGKRGLQKAMAVSQAKLEQITKERMARAAKRFNS